MINFQKSILFNFDLLLNASKFNQNEPNKHIFKKLQETKFMLDLDWANFNWINFEKKINNNNIFFDSSATT